MAVDIRKDSPNFGKWLGEELSEYNKYQLFIPKGFGHAFLTLSKEAIISYKVDKLYYENYDSGIRYNDPIININWKLNKNQIILSDKDNNLPYI